MKKQTLKGVSIYLLSSLLLLTLFTSCKKPVPVDLTKKDSIALVSFTLDKTLVPKGSTETDNGPGLLEKAVVGKEKMEEFHFKYHNQCLETLLSQYQEKIQKTLLDIPFVDFKDVTGNAQYQEITKYVPKIIMGSDVALGSHALTTGGLNYVSEYNNKKLDSLCAALGTKNLLLVAHKIEYDAAKAFISAGVSHLHLNTDITIYEQAVGIVSSKKFTITSEKGLNLIAGLPNRKKFEPAIAEMNMRMFKKIKDYYLFQKQKSDELAAAPQQ